jgi:hypothetical protein
MAEAMKRSLIDRIIGVAKLDAGTFEEIKDDEPALGPGLVIAALSGVSLGIGFVIGVSARLHGYEREDFLFMADLFLVLFIVSGLVSLILFTTVAYIIGITFPGKRTGDVTWMQLFRVLAFAGVPLMAAGWMSFLNLIILWSPALIIVIGWFLAAVIVALRQVANLTTSRAIVTVLAALIPVLIFLALACLAGVAFYLD